MNRRNFFRSLATAVAGFSILPPATTYSRIWKATRPKSLFIAEYKYAFNPEAYVGKWVFLLEEDWRKATNVGPGFKIVKIEKTSDGRFTQREHQW